MDDRFVVDNSMVMAWCFADEGTPHAEAVLESLTHAVAVVPAIWPLEAGNVLLVAERKKRLDRAAAVRFMEILRSLPIEVEQESPSRMLGEIVSLARDQKISTYDASYLDLAMRGGLPLATLDHTLIQAAKRCRVKLYHP
ncbi:MAG: type II toxin-antitoxin system VapC family toxin [Deltaproteobacteria bacterium]|nr:type II toxin-antitoxin system VapC family toxin [Deltaproteobacteria bacterium]